MASTVLPEPAVQQSPRRSAFRSLLLDPVGVTGLVMVCVIGLAALLAPLLSPHDPTHAYPGLRLQGPSSYFFLGSDELGRDLLSRALHAANNSLRVSVSVGAAAAVIGITLGLIAGYVRGWLDAVIMRIMDVLFAFPTILLALAVVATLGTDMRNLVIALTIVYIPAFARITRGAAMTIAGTTFIDAGRALGVGHIRLVSRHVLPNIIAPIAVQCSVALAEIILVEASLSYLGLGVQAPNPSWGGMLASGKAYVEFSIWPSLVPGLFIVFTVLGFNLLGDALRDSLDPRLRAALK